MIRSFKCKDTRTLFGLTRVPRFRMIEDTARRKLEYIDAARSPEDLRVPPGNHLERLRGDRLGQYSIRINKQFRICFVWLEDGAHDVEIVDYHQ